MAKQNDWRCCNKCQGLSYSPHREKSRCPAGGKHVSTSGDYTLPVNVTPNPPAHQNDWRWCNNCQGLFYGPHREKSRCPAGGKHISSRSGDYTLNVE